MNVGNQITNIRKTHGMTQEELGQLLHVTRQTVSNWENAKSYPDLQTLVDISNRFDVSLDTILKGDETMVKAIDMERLSGRIRKEKFIIDFFTGAGTGILVSCLFSPASAKRTAAIAIALVMLLIGWYQNARSYAGIYKRLKELA